MHFLFSSWLSPFVPALLVISFALTSSPVDAFSLSSLPSRPVGTRAAVTIQEMAAIETAGLVAISATVGALSQLPRLQELERELDKTRHALAEAEMSVKDQLEALEEKLFVMDKEYESQTARFKKQYDDQMKKELESVTLKIKEDFQFKLEIEVEEEKSKLLTDKLDSVNALTGKREQELLDLRSKQISISNINNKLEDALDRSQEELERLRKEADKKKLFFWPF